jgi:hypothetical protein
MRFQDRPLFYFSPDEGAGDAFADPGGFSTAEYYEGDEQVPDVKPEPAPAATETKPAETEPPVEAKTETTETAPGEVPPVVAQEAPAEPVAETTEVKPPVTASDALTAMCELLGITETDPARQQEAINAVKEQRAQAEVQQQEARAAKRVADAEKGWQETAEKSRVQAALNVMRQQGIEIERPQWWTAEAWPELGEAAAERASELTDFYQNLYNSDGAKAIYDNTVNQSRAEYETGNARVAAALEKYPQYNVELIAQCQDVGFAPQAIENVARLTHEHTNRAIAKANSAIVAKDAELTTLRQSVSGHAAAIAQAKEAGLAEGRAAALKELGDGRSLPNTTGIGTTAEKPFGVKDPNALLDGWSKKDIEEAMYATSNGHRR